MELPEFRYHPNPYTAGVVAGAEEACECCGEARGLFYTGPFYSKAAVTYLCLWCVADGRAAEKFDGQFVDSRNFSGTRVDGAIVSEVTRRTPSYQAWQQEQWLVHCDDACEFRGYPTLDELEEVPVETKSQWANHNDLDIQDWDSTVGGFAAGDAGFYKFICRHCGQALFASDWS